MTIRLFHFSGTGNTRFIAEKILENAERGGQDVDDSAGS